MIFNMTTGTTKTPVLNTSYPANVTVVCGTSATFKVTISEAGIPATYTYQWYVNDTAVSGATSATYTRSTSSDKGTYSVYCKVTNVAGTVVSRTATLTVNKTPVLNTSYPANASVTIHNSTTLKVTVSTAGYPTSYTYQWYKGSSAISGATSSTYKFTPTATGTTTFYCKVTNTAGTVTSRTATITCNPITLSLTSGWKSASTAMAGWTPGTVTCGSRLTLELTGYTDTIAATPTAAVDLTDIDSIQIVIDSDSSNLTNRYNWLAVIDSNEFYWNPQSAGNVLPTNITVLASTQFSASGTVTLDTSSISGSYYPAIMATGDKIIYCSEVNLS